MMKANKDAFICVGKEYMQYQEQFNEFVKLIKPLEKTIPSLKFGEQSDTRIELNFLGYSYSIRHCCINNSAGKLESKLLSMSKITIDDDDKYAQIISLSMDHLGCVHLPDGGNGILISRYSEEIFFILLDGKYDL